MNVHFLSFWNNFRDHDKDHDFYKKELAVNKLAEPLGFDTLFCVEHHFNGYSMSPDNFQFLGYMAAITDRIKLGTMGVILPWNDPLRVAERALVLDHLSDGRAILGMARGLAKREYNAFQIELEESRDRFDESARMVCNAVETGFIEGDGPYYRQPQAPLRPGPFKSFEGRKYMVAMSPDTVPICAEVGATQAMFAYKPWEDVVGDIENHRSLFLQHHGVEAPPVMTADLTFCADSADEAEEGAHKYVARYFESFAEHYEIFGEHLKESKSYSHYSDAGSALEIVGHEAMVEGFVNANVWGTPQQILEKYEARGKIIGDFQANTIFSYSGMDYDTAKNSMTTFAEKVMPELRSWGKK